MPASYADKRSNGESAQDESAEVKQARKKQNRQSWKAQTGKDGKGGKGSKDKDVVADEVSAGNDNNNDDKKKKERRQSKSRPLSTSSFSAEDKDQLKDLAEKEEDITEKSGQQRRKSVANAGDSSSKNTKNNNDKSAAHRRGKSVATPGEIKQGGASPKGATNRGNKEDPESKSEAMESLQQIIASLKSLPAPKPPVKKEDEDAISPVNSGETTAKHHRRESSSVTAPGLSGPAKRSPANKHKKGASVSFSFPLTTGVAATTSLTPIQDAEDGKPADINAALQDTLSHLRRMSLDKGKLQQKKDEEEKEKSPAEVKRSPFDFRKPADEQTSLATLAANKTGHRRGQSLGHVLTLSSPSTSSTPFKPSSPTHGRRHSVALNGSNDVLKEIERSQKANLPDAKGGHRRSNSRNFESNWRTSGPQQIQPFQSFQPPKFGIIQKKQQQNQQNMNNQQQRKSLFAPYLPQASLPPLLKSQQLVSGVLRINKRNRSDAYVTSESLDTDIYICGSKDRNRALEGDVVAVELLDPEKVWQTKREKEEKKRKKEESAGIDKKMSIKRKMMSKSRVKVCYFSKTMTSPPMSKGQSTVVTLLLSWNACLASSFLVRLLF